MGWTTFVCKDFLTVLFHSFFFQESCPSENTAHLFQTKSGQQGCLVNGLSSDLWKMSSWQANWRENNASFVLIPDSFPLSSLPLLISYKNFHFGLSLFQVGDETLYSSGMQSLLLPMEESLTSLPSSTSCVHQCICIVLNGKLFVNCIYWVARVFSRILRHRKKKIGKLVHLGLQGFKTLSCMQCWLWRRTPKNDW